METTITRQLLDTEHRTAHTAKLFGTCFPLQLEPFVFTIASDLARDYKGGFWNFYSLGNGGFYLAPDSEKQFSVRCHNYYEGVLSADALGIVVCLYAYSVATPSVDVVAVDQRSAPSPISSSIPTFTNSFPLTEAGAP